MATSGQFSGEIIKIEHAEGSSSILVRDDYNTSMWVEFDHQEMILVRDEWFVPGQDVTVGYRSYFPQGPQGNKAMAAGRTTAIDPDGRVGELAYEREDSLIGGDRAVEEPAATWSMFEPGRVAETFSLNSEDPEEATESVNESIDAWLRAHPGDQGMFQIVPSQPEDLAFLPKGEVYFDGSGDLPTYWLTPDGSGAFPIERESDQAWIPWKQTWVVDGERLSVTVTEEVGQRLGSAQIVPVPEGHGLDARAAHLALVEGPRHLREQAGRTSGVEAEGVLGWDKIQQRGFEAAAARLSDLGYNVDELADQVMIGREGELGVSDEHRELLVREAKAATLKVRNEPSPGLDNARAQRQMIGLLGAPWHTGLVRERLMSSLTHEIEATAPSAEPTPDHSEIDLQSTEQVVVDAVVRNVRWRTDMLDLETATEQQDRVVQSTVRGTLVSTPREVETANHGHVVVTRLVQEPTQAGELPRYYDVAMDPSTGGLGVNARYSLEPGDQVVVVGRESREPYVVAGEGRIQHRMWAQDVLVSLKENSVEGISPDAPEQVRSPGAGVDPVQYAVEQNTMSTPVGPEAAGPSR